MDSDPEDGYHTLIVVLNDSALLWAMDGVRKEKEE